MEIVFAPEERDVYSYERVPNDVAPLGAKAGRRTLAKESVALLRSLKSKKGSPGYKPLAPSGPKRWEGCTSKLNLPKLRVVVSVLTRGSAVCCLLPAVCQRKTYRHNQSAIRRVSCVDVAAVQSHGTLGNCQS